MATQMSDRAVKDATGKEWAEWFAILDAAGMRDQPHKEIVAWLWDTGTLARPWWGQMMVVEYERFIGRREAGQRCDGAWTAGVSRTVAGDMDSALASWQRVVSELTEFNGIPRGGEPRVSSTAKWRYWRCDFLDGSSVSVNISAKGDGKAGIAVDHGKIESDDAAKAWKAFWRTLLSEVQ